MKSTNLPDFSNKLVSINFTGGQYGRSLINPHWEAHSGRLFLVGAIPPDTSTSDWCEGMVAGIAWDMVTEYLLFDSLEQYRERIARFAKTKQKRKV